MSVVITVVLVAALLAASAWTVLVAIAGAVEILPPRAAPESGEGTREVAHPFASRVTARPEA